MTTRLGILAYGSLVDDPGAEIAAATCGVRSLGIVTPFAVEFARASRSRAGAPTLVPVTSGGRPVPARILLLREDVHEVEAANMLWRRETGRTGAAPMPGPTRGPDDVIIDRLTDFHGVSCVLYTWIAPNIAPLAPRRLAELALRSTRNASVARKGRDGIGYLMAALQNGARTRLSGAYASEILRLTGTSTLADARARACGRAAKARPAKATPAKATPARPQSWPQSRRRER